MGVRTWTVPGYTEVSELDGARGTGGAGRAALATHTATGALVAIRYLADDRRHDEVWLATYRADNRLLAAVDSPHLVGLYEYVESADGAATVREYVDGVALSDLIAARRLRPEAALTVLKGALLGLLAADAAGVQCRYAPAGVLIDRDGRTKLTDGAGDVAEGPLTADVAAAFATFLECLPGSATAPAAARLPSRLRSLVAPAAAGHGVALLAELDTAARAAYGVDWESAGRRRLAHDVARLQARLPRPSRPGR
jgi:hypothetical protein